MAIENDPDSPGTRFKLFVQSPYDGEGAVPETIEVSCPAGTVGPGPESDRMYAIYPVGKADPYGDPEGGQNGFPPWGGEILPPAMPDNGGHFDHLEPGTRQFEMAHIFAAAQFTLDVWELYFGHQIRWHFADHLDKLELSILPTLDNAQIGWGFLEAGGAETPEVGFESYALNFDIVAHEIGHAIIYSEVGMPTLNVDNDEYYGFHESAADIVALLASLHLPSVVDDVLARTRGNLYTLNKLSRFAELSSNRQIRMAANDLTMADFGRHAVDEHDLAQPLTGALFDIFVDIFHENLLDANLIEGEVEDLSDRLEGHPVYAEVMQGLFDRRYSANPEGFRAALLEARDYLGSYLAEAWQMLDVERLDYPGVGRALTEMDRAISGGRYGKIIGGNFAVRGMVAGNHRRRRSDALLRSHSNSTRTRIPF